MGRDTGTPYYVRDDMMIRGKWYELEYTIWDITIQNQIKKRGLFIFIKYENHHAPSWGVTQDYETYTFYKLLGNGKREKIFLFDGEFEIIRCIPDSEITFEMI